MSSRAQLEKLTGIASRFGAFVAERHPFALADALDAFEEARAGREPRTDAEIDAVRPLLGRALARRLQAHEVPPGLGETTPRTSVERRIGQAHAALLDDCDGFLRRAAI